MKERRGLQRDKSLRVRGQEAWAVARVAEATAPKSARNWREARLPELSRIEGVGDRGQRRVAVGSRAAANEQVAVTIDGLGGAYSRARTYPPSRTK